MLATMLKISVGLLLYLSISSYAAAPNVAFYYGANPPWDALQAYDIVVVEPEHAIDAARVSNAHMQVFAYLSVGEVEFKRPYAKELPEGLVSGDNDPWRSHVVDQTHSEWPRFFVERIVAPLWQAGYRGFFLDTLDSFQLIASNDEERVRQAQGLVTVIRALRARFPEAKLIFNRGFEVLPELHREAYAVAAESVFRGWDQKNRSYREVSPADRTWLLQQLTRVRSEYNLPVIAIEYTPPEKRDLARETARKIAALGFIPWVANSELNQLGIGNVEVVPRKVLMLYDGAGRDAQLYAHRIHQQAKMPFNDLGYEVDYADISKPLPAYPLIGRYAGIVSWFADDQAVRKPGVREWLTRQREHGMRMAVLGSFPFPLTDSLAAVFGLSVGAPRAPRTVSIEVRDPLISHDSQPALGGRVFTPLRANQPSATLLRLRTDSGETMDAAALMPWGGYVLTPYESEPIPGAPGDRWLIQPVEFMRRALALPAIPASRRSERLQPDGTLAQSAAPALAPAEDVSVCPHNIGGRPLTGASQGGVTRYGLKKNASERPSITCAS
jgi:uncharacterized protein (TIGR01370 family)